MSEQSKARAFLLILFLLHSLYVEMTMDDTTGNNSKGRFPRAPHSKINSSYLFDCVWPRLASSNPANELNYSSPVACSTVGEGGGM